MSCDCERLAEAIYREIERQLPKRGGDRLLDNRDLQSVLVDGQLDLVRIAASLTRRFCVLGDDLETVIADEAGEMGDASGCCVPRGTEDGAIPLNAAKAG